VFRDLVIARIAEPTSEADSMRVLTDLGANVLSYRTIQRHLAQIGPGGYRDLIATPCFAHAADTGGLGLNLVRRHHTVMPTSYLGLPDHRPR
jgi:hypothetical protein